MSRLANPTQRQVIVLGVLLTGLGAMFSPPLRVVAQPPEEKPSDSSGTIASVTPQPLATPVESTIVAPIVPRLVASSPITSGRSTAAIGPITGQGTTDNIAKFTGTNAIGNSLLVEKSGKIGLGTASPAGLLSVAGTNSNTYSIYSSNAGAGSGLFAISSNGMGVYGYHSASSIDLPGVMGETNSTSANAAGVLGTIRQTAPGAFSAGVRGNNKGTGVNGFGVYGSHAGSGSGVYGISPNGNGVWGTSVRGFGVRGSYTGTSTNPGVLGETSSTAASASGVQGTVSSTSPGGFSAGVRGINNGTAGLGVGVYGSQAGSGYGVYGYTPSGTGILGSTSTGIGVYGTSGSGSGVQGNSTNSSGVYGASSSGNGVYGSSGTGRGVSGVSNSGYGVYAQSTSTFGLYALSSGSNSAGINGVGYVGIQGITNSTAAGAQGVRGDNGGSNTNGYAGYFNGRVTVSGNLDVKGTLTKSAGSFKIDHPLHPATEFLSHSFVESPDMMNVYNGNITLNSEGEATVQLPDYFQALNRDFRYQLTCIGAPALVYVAQKISRNHFKIAGGKPAMEVSWQVTGIRQDAYARQHPIKVEEVKSGDERGKYLYPAGFGAGRNKQIAPPEPRFAAR